MHKWERAQRGAHNRQRRKKQTPPHLFAFTLAPLLSFFPSFRPLRGSSARTAALADDFLANFGATSRPSPGGEGEELLSSSSATSFNSGSSAALPPKKYKSRKTPKHTAITTTLQCIRMVRATCCGWKRQAGVRSCLRVKQGKQSWHFLTAPRSHFSADDDVEQSAASHRPWRITQRRCGFSGATVIMVLLQHYYIIIPWFLSYRFYLFYFYLSYS